MDKQDVIILQIIGIGLSIPFILVIVLLVKNKIQEIICARKGHTFKEKYYKGMARAGYSYNICDVILQRQICTRCGEPHENIKPIVVKVLEEFPSVLLPSTMYNCIEYDGYVIERICNSDELRWIQSE